MAERLLRLLRFFAPQTAFSHRLNRGENMTIDEFLTNVRRIQAADPRYRLGRDGSDGYCDCIGLVIGAIRRSGGQWRGIHGTNWTARNAMHDLNPLRGAGQLRRGELVFRAHEPGAKGYAARWQFHGMLTMFAGRIGLMQVGDSGDAVKGLQSALMAAGFPLPLHGADGNFGAETEQALRQFQQKSGLNASGAADAETLAALRLLNG